MPEMGQADCKTLAVIDSRLSRRTLLLASATTAAAAGLSSGLTGCEADPPASGAPEEASIEALTPVLVGQHDLLDSYERAFTAFPELAVALAELPAQTSAHTEALLAAAPAAAAQATASLPASASASTSPVPPPQPASDVATARLALRRVVDTAAGRLGAAALRADGDLAALLGSCAASTACHARLLG